MFKILVTIFTGIIVSFYYFPFEFSFLPGINTKMLLAVVGVICALFSLIRARETRLPFNLLRIEGGALLVSLVGVFSIVINNTSDYAYATYFISMTVWLSGAYATCLLIKAVHEKITVERVTIYVAAICAMQCVLALVIDSYAGIKSIVDTYIMQDQFFLTEVERLYGIGASLDTAGVRFSACLILIVYSINKNKSQMTNVAMAFAIAVYLLIAVVGNMIARTTIVGVSLSMLYAIMTFKPTNVNLSFFRVARVVLIILVVVIPLCKYLYASSPQFYEWSRFAFEGFFNLAETGEWEIDSNETLKTMVVFPDNAKTWIIGDAYFVNPNLTDYTYVGPYTLGGYYMGTDIGFLRFIFYFGLIGLLTFSYFFISVAKECSRMLPEYGQMIVFVLILGFIIWLKVATDVFLVFALLICVGNMQDKTPQLEAE